MRKRDIYVGNINKCVKRVMTNDIEKGESTFGYSVIEGKPYKENAILIKLGKDTYADLEKIDSYLYYAYLKSNSNDEYLQRAQLVLTTSPVCCNSLYVDESSLKPYESLTCEKYKISIKRLKLEVSHRLNNLDI